MVTWLRCYMVMWLRGYMVMWLRGYVDGDLPSASGVSEHPLKSQGQRVHGNRTIEEVFA